MDRVGSSMWYGGLAATAVGTALAFILDLGALPAPAWTGLLIMTLGGAFTSLASVPILVARGGRRPGLAGKGWARFWESRVGKWLFKLAGVGLKELPGPVTGYRPTEMAIRMAAERLFEQLPKDVRQEMPELPALVQRLEEDAQVMRRRIEELGGLLSDVEAAGRAG